VYVAKKKNPHLPRVELKFLTKFSLQSQFIDSEEDIRIAYLILTHSIDTLRGASRVLRRLYKAKHTFLVHIDSSPGLDQTQALDSLFTFFTAKERQEMLETNVLVFSEHNLKWGAFSIVEAELTVRKFKGL